MYPREYFDTYWRPDLRDEVFVAMPFSDDFEPVWKSVICPAIEEDQPRNLAAHRVDATVLAGSVITEIMEGIARARLVLADISITPDGKWAGQRNGNVMYEVGLAHALRQATEVILIRSDRQPISFDVSGIKIYDYENDDLPDARSRLASLISDHLAQIEHFKSLKVEFAVASLDSGCLELMWERGASPQFSDPQPKFEAQKATLVPARMTTAKLLELGIIYCHYSPSESSYAYRWTEFGYAVLRKLGVPTKTT